MSVINTLIGTPLGWVMWVCYRWLGSYGGAILLFTLVSKVILLPVSILVQKNSIKMVKLQPELNRIHVEHYGDRDRIADKSMELYQRERYSPALGMVPLVIQILLVLGLISVIYHPMQHLLHLDAGVCRVLTDATASLLGTEELGAGAQLRVMSAMAEPANEGYFLGLASSLPGTDLPGLMAAVRGVDMHFLGLDLSMVPPLVPVTALLLIPLLSCLSTFALCWAQNRENVLQREQSFWGRWGPGLFTVAFSTWFTFLVPAGVGLYWIASNVLSILLLYLLNRLYPPEREIDYEALERSKQQLAARKAAKKEEVRRLLPYRKREKRDYRRFLRDKEPKRLVFYSESSGFYKYYAGMIGYVMEHSDLVIHYITSDPNDQVFAMESPRFRAYYIGELRLIPLMMKLDADMVLMTVPDLELFHLRRSLVRKDIEYVYVEHGIGSDNLLGRPHSLDHYDTIFNTGPHQTEESRALEELYGLAPRRLVKVGYSLIDEMTAAWEAAPKKGPEEQKTVLIAPSWQKDNIMDSCIDNLLDQLLPLDCRLIVRPHPQYVRLYPDRVEALKERYGDYLGPDFEIQTDFSSNDTVYQADLLITDWSNISMEFAFSTLKPVLYINTPMKVMNPEYQRIPIVPIDIWIRSELGGQLDPEKLDRAGETVWDLLSRQEEFRERIARVKGKAMYNIGHGGEAAGRYIVGRLAPRDKEA